MIALASADADKDGRRTVIVCISDEDVPLLEQGATIKFTMADVSAGSGKNVSDDPHIYVIAMTGVVSGVDVNPEDMPVLRMLAIGRKTLEQLQYPTHKVYVFEQVEMHLTRHRTEREFAQAMAPKLGKLLKGPGGLDPSSHPVSTN